MACNLRSAVGTGSTACKENFSGVGGTAYLFLKSDLNGAPTYSEGGNTFKTGTFKFKSGGGVYDVKLKKAVNSVTWSNNANSGGYTVTATFTVADDMNKMAFNGRTLNNLGGDWGVLIPTANPNEFYVIFNYQLGLSTFTVEGTTGDAPDSDHGHTYTVAATMYYGPTVVTLSENELTILKDVTYNEDGTTDTTGSETE